jgi:hypothetical protein
MFSHMFFIAMTIATMTAAVVMANTVAGATDDRVRFHDSGQFSEADDLDKTGTTGGRKKNNGPQVLCYKVLRAVFLLERRGEDCILSKTGYKPVLRRIQKS